MHLVGIDIGGSGIKGALVDIRNGKFVGERIRLATPQPATPPAVAEVVSQIVAQLGEDDGPIGCTFPAIIRHGVSHSAANVDDAWIGTNIENLLMEQVKRPVHVLNDADAAGMAEMKFGAGRKRNKGVVIILTIGTGIGSAIFVDGRLLPNTELGHLEIRGKDAEHRASDRVREEEALTWKKWAKRFNEYLQHVEFLFSPDLIILGGGTSKKFDKFASLLEVDVEVIPAELRNDAGIVGAALRARELERYPSRA